MDQQKLDAHLDKVLRAAGSALRHYSLPKSKKDMRAALQAAIEEAVADHIDELERRLGEAEARVAELERAEQEPALYVQSNHFAQAKFSPFLALVCQQPIEVIATMPLYAAPPVAAQAEGYVTALRYIAWESAGYMDCVHAAKRAIGEMGALPPPPKIQPAEAGG